MTLAAGIARQAVEAVRLGIPQSARDDAKLALIDWWGATLAGWRTPEAGILLATCADETGSGRARLLDGRAASPQVAALLNGAISHIVELDDIYAPALYHPGCPTVAAALAASQMANRGGADLLDAIVIGYEVGNRIGEALQPAHYRFWHTTGTIGCLGAAAAAGIAISLDAPRLRHAIANAASFAAGLQQAFRSDSMTKPLHAGRAAQAGVFAALAAAQGLTGASDMLEGPAGLAAATAEGADLSAVLQRFGTPWTVGGITRKDHACCGHAFAAIDGALALRGRTGDLEAIRAIRVETCVTAIEVAGNPAPRSPFEAKFSIAFAVASALQYGRVRLEAFTPARVREPLLQALAARVSLHVSPHHDKGYPALRGATVTIEMADGTTIRHEQATRRGSPEYPMSDAEIAEKFLELAGAHLPGEAATALLNRLRTIDAPGSNLFFN